MDTKCVECDATITVPSDSIVGEIVSCKECGTAYEIAQVKDGTVMLKQADAVEEDWGE